MSDEERELMWAAMSPEYRNFKMIELLTQKVDQINNATQEKIELIVNQQAQFAVNQQKSEERVSKIEDIIGRLASATFNRMEDSDTMINALIDSHTRTDAKISSLSEDVERKISALIDSHIQTEESVRKTEESIRNLAAVVDRYLSEGHNGKS